MLVGQLMLVQLVKMVDSFQYLVVLMIVLVVVIRLDLQLVVQSLLNFVFLHQMLLQHRATAWRDRVSPVNQERARPQLRAPAPRPNAQARRTWTQSYTCDATKVCAHAHCSR